MSLYRLLADLVLIVHASLVAFVIFGLILVIVGWAMKWSWVRNFWFRAGHLLAIGIVVAQAWCGVSCPLTILENRLRVAGGEEPYSDQGCIAFWLHRFIFFEAPDWVFTVAYTAFGLLVIGGLLLCPPSWPWRKRENHEGTDAGVAHSRS